jgi:transposase
VKTIATIGLDIAKQVFQVHGVDKAGRAVLRRREAARFRGPTTRDRLT